MSQYEDDENLLKVAVRNYFDSSETSPTVQIRYRPPLIQTSNHDARSDAISLAFESMVYRNFPLWAAYMLSYEFVDLYAEKLGTMKVPFTEDYNIIDGNLWYRQVIDCFEEYMKELIKGIRKLPVMPKEWAKLPISYCAQKNRKPKMEDRHIILPSLIVVEPRIEIEEKYTDSFFAVFDGHHGAECAAYASGHFVECLFEALIQTKDGEQVLKEAFDRIDKKITARCHNENVKSGTTASCLYLKKGKIAYLAWCGDSSIAVLQRNTVYTISTPHKPDNPEEMKRIEDAGGIVVSVHGVPRLNGILNLSRSLGDIRAKPMVSSTPDLYSYHLTEHDYIIFLSSDGVWDNLSADEVYNAIRFFISNHSMRDYKLLAEFINNKAKEAGATDNLTLICIYLKPLEEVWAKFILQ